METKDISYFDLSLRAFLREYHPNLVHSVNFVSSRAEDAEIMYNNRMKESGNTVLALEEANQVLFAGLNFSKLSFLKDVLENEFFLEIQKGDVDAMALSYFNQKEIQNVFDNYALLMTLKKMKSVTKCYIQKLQVQYLCK